MSAPRINGRLTEAGREMERALAADRAQHREVARLRKAMQDAIDVLGPGWDEASDSPGTQAFAVLWHALHEVQPLH